MRPVSPPRPSGPGLGKRALREDRVKPICSFPLPHTLKQLRGFLDIIGFCRLWIPVYVEIAGPLYQMIKEAQKDSLTLLEWEPAVELAFLKQLKPALLQAPVLSFPTGQDFNPYASERGGMALGVLLVNHY